MSNEKNTTFYNLQKVSILTKMVNQYHFQYISNLYYHIIEYIKCFWPISKPKNAAIQSQNPIFDPETYVFHM